MSKLYVDAVEPEGASTVLTLGTVGDTVNIGGTAGTGFPTGGGTVGVQVYDSSSSPYTWNKSDRQTATGKTINRVLVEVQASGGGGGSTVNGWGGGGLSLIHI